MSLNRVSVLGAALALAVTAAAMAATTAQADTVNRTIEDNNQNDCLDNGATLSSVDCAAAKRKSGYDFGVAVKASGKPAYTIDNVWVRVRKADGSGSADVAHHKDDVTIDNIALSEFHVADVAAKLGMTVAQLQANGFQIRPKIESLGAGGGRQDRCPAVSFRFDGSGWAWALGGSPAASDYAGIGSGFVLFYRAGGSINDVKCRFKAGQSAS